MPISVSLCVLQYRLHSTHQTSLHCYDLFAMSGCLAETQDSRPFPPSPPRDICYWLLGPVGGEQGSVVTQRLISCVILSSDNLLTGLVFHPSYIPPPDMFVFPIHRACLQINKGSGAESRHKYVSLLYVGLKISTSVLTD